MTVNQATTFTYPIAFSSNNVLAFKQAKSNSNGNNYLMREAGIGIPNNFGIITWNISSFEFLRFCNWLVNSGDIQLSAQALGL